MSVNLREIFKKNLLWKVLTFFLQKPSTEVYVKELSRILGVGPTGANNALRRLEEMKLLQKRERARTHFYMLDNESILVRQLKVTYFLARLEDVQFVRRCLDADENLISLCIYGSFADGRFDEKSDLDVLIIAQQSRDAFASVIPPLERLLKLEVNIETLSISKWNRLKEKDKGFYQEVLLSHILLYGSEIS